jgi:hypothetical protein
MVIVTSCREDLRDPQLAHCEHQQDINQHELMYYKRAIYIEFRFLLFMALCLNEIIKYNSRVKLVFP